MVHEYFIQRAAEIEQTSMQRRAALKTPEDVRVYIEGAREKIQQCFGPWPDKTPLNVRITNTIDRGAYRIENVLFESRPGFLVTANCYVPQHKPGPFPGVIGTCGHSPIGKASENDQRYAQTLAAMGYVVLVFDPLGQGERRQLMFEPVRSRAVSPTREHQYAGNQQFLVGEFLGSWRAWDGIRALDYLVSRPDVDSRRVGVTGCSGGGTMTTWLAGLERRFTMAAPSCFVTTFRHNLENELPADIEQCPPKVLQFGLDHMDFLAATAPNPVIILAQKQDFFDLRGARDAFEQLRNLYATLGQGRHVAMHEGPGGHGYSLDHREAMYAWFNTATQVSQLQTESETRVEKTETLYCTPAGQVHNSGSKSVQVFTREKSQQLAAQRSVLSVSALRQQITDLLRLEKRAERNDSERVPQYRILTGPIHLKSNVNLHLAEGSTLLFSKEIDDYLPLVHSRNSGVELMNYSPLIYAFEQENIAVTGSGTLNGQADTTHWWPMTGIRNWGWKPGIPTPEGNWELLYQMVDNNVPVSERVFPNGIYYRPPFIQPYRCWNILIEGVTVIDSPFWCVTPELSQNVTVRNVTVRSHGPNNDGCNPVSCKDVLIEGCFFDTGDDCVAIKSGRDADGRRVNTPSENIIIRNCRMKDGHGGVVIGSEISGGIRNVFAEDCVMDSPQLNCGLRIKTNSSRGGFAENIFMRNIKIGEVGDVVHVTYFYRDGDVGTFTPMVRNVHVENVTSEKSLHGLMMMGYAYSPITDIHLKNCRFNNAKNGNKLINVQHVTAQNVIINGEPFDGVEDEMVPPAVMATLQPHLKGGHMRRVDKWTDNGAVLFEFVVDGADGRDTLVIAEDGTLR